LYRTDVQFPEFKEVKATLPRQFDRDNLSGAGLPL